MLSNANNAGSDSTVHTQGLDEYAQCQKSELRV